MAWRIARVTALCCQEKETNRAPCAWSILPDSCGREKKDRCSVEIDFSVLAKERQGHQQLTLASGSFATSFVKAWWVQCC